jgi:hypothetical protein
MSVWARSHPGRKLSRAHFVPLLKEASQKSTAQSNVHFLFETYGIYPYNREKVPKEAFSISGAVSSASVNDNDGTDKYKSSDRGSLLGTKSSRSSSSLQAGNQPQAGPSFGVIGPVSISDPLLKRRKRTTAVLTDKEHLHQAKLLRQKANGLAKNPVRLIPELQNRGP